MIVQRHKTSPDLKKRGFFAKVLFYIITMTFFIYTVCTVTLLTFPVRVEVKVEVNVDVMNHGGGSVPHGAVLVLEQSHQDGPHPKHSPTWGTEKAHYRGQL